MRMMLRVSIQVEAGNQAIKAGTLPKTIIDFVGRMKPEASYFVAEKGKRTAYFFFDLADPKSIPPAVEPFFMQFNAEVELLPAMNLDDMKAGVRDTTGS